MLRNFQISQREEMVAAQETRYRAGQEERLEGLLGLLEGHHAPFLSLRFTGNQGHGGGT